MMYSYMQRPFVHGTSLQQSACEAQSWPYSAQTGPGPSGTPASIWRGGVCGMPQTPWVEPTGWMQVYPVQQSALTEHGPPTGTQTGGKKPPSIRGAPPSCPPGVPKQRRRPVPSGTQGARLQQSCADAQMPFFGMQVSPRPLHRGTPMKSSWQTPELPVPAQQLLRADDAPQV